MVGFWRVGGDGGDAYHEIVDWDTAYAAEPAFHVSEADV